MSESTYLKHRTAQALVFLCILLFGVALGASFGWWLIIGFGYAAVILYETVQARSGEPTLALRRSATGYIAANVVLACIAFVFALATVSLAGKVVAGGYALVLAWEAWCHYRMSIHPKDESESAE